MMSTVAKLVLTLLMPTHLLFGSAKNQYPDIINEINELHATYDANTRLLNLGKSLEGRSIVALEMGNPNAQKKVYLNAAHHGNEIASTVGLLGAMKFILSNHNDKRIKNYCRGLWLCRSVGGRYGSR